MPTTEHQTALAAQVPFSTFVDRLCKPGEDVLRELTPDQAHVWHMATGVSGEAGELLDAIKKCVVYQKPLDRENVVEELGDLEFYMEALRSALGVTREETLSHCRAKLAKRYVGLAYSNEAAQIRADKNEDTQLPPSWYATHVCAIAAGMLVAAGKDSPGYDMAPQLLADLNKDHTLASLDIMRVGEPGDMLVYITLPNGRAQINWKGDTLTLTAVKAPKDVVPLTAGEKKLLRGFCEHVHEQQELTVAG